MKLNRIVGCLITACAMTGCSESVSNESQRLPEAGRENQLGGDAPEPDDTDDNTQLDPPKSRTFELEYAATVSELPVDTSVRIWFPVPQSGSDQTVEPIGESVPKDLSVKPEPRYGNQVAYFEAKAPASGVLELKTAYRIRRQEVHSLDGTSNSNLKLTDEQRVRFLSANTTVPLDGKPFEMIRDVAFKSSTIDIGRELYNRVDDHVKYDKSKSGYGKGDVLWVCDSRTGNCTDFHSLFISWARAKGIPARFEIGFPLPGERGEGSIGGYHCWAAFYVEDRGWVPVDISEADKHPELKEYYFGNLTENRVAFTVGRDIVLNPKQDGPPLNYFVYPYVEVDGKPWSRDNIKLDFSFNDVEGLSI